MPSAPRQFGEWRRAAFASSLHGIRLPGRDHPPNLTGVWLPFRLRMARLTTTAPKSGSVERPLTAAPASLRSFGSHIPLRKVRAVTLRTPYLLFIGDAHDQLAAKTAAGIAFWRPEICLGQLRLPATPIQQLIRDGHCLIGKPRCTAAAITAPFDT